MSLDESDLIPCNEVHALVATILPKKENESVAQAGGGPKGMCKLEGPGGQIGLGL